MTDAYTQCPSCEKKGWHRPARAAHLDGTPWPQVRRCRYCQHDNRLLLAERELQTTFDAHSKRTRALKRERP